MFGGQRDDYGRDKEMSTKNSRLFAFQLLASDLPTQGIYCPGSVA